MLDEVRIQNFKCFRDIAVSMRPLTVLTGINGTGKSSFIQALLMLRQSGSSGGVLNGSLVSLGYGYDVLYESAEDDSNITFSLKEGMNEHEISFAYEKYSRILKSKGYIQDGILWGENFYYLGAERTGPRIYFPLFPDNQLNLIGNNGEYCASLLNDNADIKMQAEAWLSELGQAVRINIQEVRDSDITGLTFSFLRDGDNLWSNRFRASNTGFGLTYVLPVISSCLLAGSGGMVIVENPEAHLHPKGQAMLGTFLAHTAENGVQVIIETHSDHILNGIRLAVKRGEISPENTAIHFFHYDAENMCATLDSPKIDMNGRIDLWPEGFFDEWEKSLLELL